MAAHWGAEALWAMRQAVANPAPTTIEDLDYDHAARSAVMAAWHGLRVLGRPTAQEFAQWTAEGRWP